MIIVADSGSMKCDWAVVARDGRVMKEFKTMGFHPLFHSSTLIEKILGHMSEFKTIASQIEEVYFYGPGNEILNVLALSKRLCAIFLIMLKP